MNEASLSDEQVHRYANAAAVTQTSSYHAQTNLPMAGQTVRIPVLRSGVLVLPTASGQGLRSVYYFASAITVSEQLSGRFTEYEPTRPSEAAAQ